ncbi:MAG: CDP-archaeol synthase [Candidatus Levyibacteriota bacterium]|nr:MAG: CDP-archaeol synthase [Candidatus Levybacteria bacterium]
MSFAYSIPQDILFAIWFFLPAGLANCTPIFVAKIPILKNWSYPLDCYLLFRGKRLFDNHKTIRGFITGILVAIAVIFLQKYLYSKFVFIHSFVFINYETINSWIFGILSGLGALGGDATKSFFKRQKGIPSGQLWFPFDQLDYIIGGIITTVFYIPLPINLYITLTIVWFILHLISTRIGYLFRLKQSPM